MTIDDYQPANWTAEQKQWARLVVETCEAKLGGPLPDDLARGVCAIADHPQRPSADVVIERALGAVQRRRTN